MKSMQERNSKLSTLYDEKVRLLWRSWDGEAVDDKIDSKQKEIDSVIEATDQLLDIPPKRLEGFETYGDVFTEDYWREAVEDGSFLPSDGSGYWATSEGYSYEHSDVFDRKPKWATQVVWYNK